MSCGRDGLALARQSWHPAALQEPPAPNTHMVSADSWEYRMCSGHWPSRGAALEHGSSATQSSSCGLPGWDCPVQHEQLGVATAVPKARAIMCCAEVISVSLLALLPCLQVRAGQTQLCLKRGQFFLIEITLETRVCVDLLHNNHNDCLQNTSTAKSRDFSV